VKRNTFISKVLFQPSGPKHRLSPSFEPST